MNYPLSRRTVAPDTESITTYIPVPGFGVLPVNAFLIRAAEPVLIDTGLAATRPAFLDALADAIDPEDIRWIWLTHTDPDHAGNLEEVLALAPRARLVTTYLGMGKLGLLGLPTDRAWLLNPGESLDAGDRKLVATLPPSFDAPETTAVFDAKRRTLFSADSFGAVMNEPAESADSMSPAALREGMMAWAAVDSPWLHLVEEKRYEVRLGETRSLSAETILSSHLPPARSCAATLHEHLRMVREMPPFVGPNQVALEAMMAAATAG